MSIRMGGFILVAKKEIGTIVVKVLVSAGKLPWPYSASYRCHKAIPLTGFRRNINIPWPDQGMGDGDYMYAFQQVVMPIALEFDPDLVISKTSISWVLGCMLTFIS